MTAPAYPYATDAVVYTALFISVELVRDETAIPVISCSISKNVRKFPLDISQFPLKLKVLFAIPLSLPRRSPFTIQRLPLSLYHFADFPPSRRFHQIYVIGSGCWI